MSNLQQETVKLVLGALHSTDLTIESFVIGHIHREPTLLLKWRFRDPAR